MKLIERWLVALAGAAFGLGLAGIIVHNPKLSPIWFVPTTGLLMILYSIPLLLKKGMHRELFKNLWVTIPMFIIIALVGYQMGLHSQFKLINSQVLAVGWIAPFIFAVIVLGIYLTVRVHPKILEIPFSVMLVFATIGIVYYAFATGLKSGGWLTVQNYDMTVSLLVLGCLLGKKEWRWWLSGVSIIGLYFSGAEIGLVVLVGLINVVLWRKDYGKRILLLIGVTVACLCLTFFPIGQSLWVHNGIQVTLGDRIAAGVQVIERKITPANADWALTGNRLDGNWNIKDVSLFGHGLDIDQLTESTPHNQLLIMTDQIGIIGALAWLFATIAWGIKTKNYYILCAVLVVAMLDHYYWTVGILWWYAIVSLEPQGLLFSPSSDKSQ